jgi:hypothetical protein
MRVWSPPKDFHTCGKSCGKSLFLAFHLCFEPILRGFQRGETVKGLKKRPSRALYRLQRDYKALVGGRRSAEGQFF